MPATKIQLLDHIDPLLADLTARADESRIATGYISAEAVRVLLARAGTRQRSGAGGVSILFGADLRTDPQAAEILHRAVVENTDRLQARIVPNRQGVLFHPKTYYFRSGETVHLIIGSGNLTTGGQFRNTELYCCLEMRSGSAADRQFLSIWERWWDEPFSLPLSSEIVSQLRTQADHVAELLQIRQRGNELHALLQDEQQLWQLVIAGGGPGQSGDARHPLEPREALRSQLARGFLFSTHFSLAPFQVPVTTELLAGEERIAPEESGEAVVLDSTVSAYVKLLPAEAIAEFEQLYRQADRELRALALTLPLGSYVAATAYPSFKRTAQQLRQRHRELVSRYVRDPAPMRDHLSAHLAEELQRVWEAAYPRQAVAHRRQWSEPSDTRLRPDGESSARIQPNQCLSRSPPCCIRRSRVPTSPRIRCGG